MSLRPSDKPDYSNIFGNEKEQASPVQSHSIPQQVRPIKTINHRGISDIESLSITVIFCLMIFWSIVIVLLAYRFGGVGAGLMTLAMMIAVWIIRWLTYYALWRWFWAMTALSWLIMTIFMLGAMIFSNDSINLLSRYLRDLSDMLLGFRMPF